MTPEAARTRPMAYADYLAVERTSPRKHEFFRGEVFAMAGGSPIHGHLPTRLAPLLARALGTGPCRTYSSDVRVFLPHVADLYAGVADLRAEAGEGP